MSSARSRSDWNAPASRAPPGRVCASRISGAADAACSDRASVKKMNGYLSNRKALGDHIDGDPTKDHDHGLDDQEPGRADVAGDRLREPAQGVGVVVDAETQVPASSGWTDPFVRLGMRPPLRDDREVRRSLGDPRPPPFSPQRNYGCWSQPARVERPRPVALRARHGHPSRVRIERLRGQCSVAGSNKEHIHAKAPCFPRWRPWRGHRHHAVGRFRRRRRNGQGR